jgi:hypothetical protein
LSRKEYKMSEKEINTRWGGPWVLLRIDGDKCEPVESFIHKHNAEKAAEVLSRHDKPHGLDYRVQLMDNKELNALKKGL